ncbi:MAG TPA: hypothetical protein VK550_12405 [Polyangiaceae bacterium]|nr:hypothetical protein [Polyangiaceae bacterium]
MAPYTLSDLFWALVDYVRREIAEWKRAFGWGLFAASVAFAPRRTSANVKQTAAETV